MAKKELQLRGALALREWRLTSSPRPTQTEVSIKVGVDLPRYNAFERGRARPGLDHAVKIEQLTGVPVERWTEVVPDREWKRESRRLDEMQSHARAA